MSTEIDWMNAGHADGRELAEWIRREGLMPRVGHYARDSFRSALKRWEAGEPATIPSVDCHLTAIDRHLSQVPDHVWRSEAPRYGPPETPEFRSRRLRGEAMIAAGTGARAVADAVGVSKATARKWRDAFIEKTQAEEQAA